MTLPHICHHILDEKTKTYKAGVGFTGTCSLCGAPVVQSIRTTVKPRVKPKMSKKERIKARNK